MKVIFYFSARHLGDWNFSIGFNNNLPLSGTDRSFLWLISEFYKRQISSDFYTDHPPKGSEIKFLKISSFQEIFDHFNRDREVIIITSANYPGVAKCLSGFENDGCKLVLWDHNGPGTQLEDAYRKSPNLCRVVCVSRIQADASRHRKLFSKMTFIHNPIDTDFWRPSQSKRSRNTVVYVGSLVPSKGFHHLAAAWPSVRKKIPDAQLLVCGSAKLYNRGERLGPLGIASESYETEHIVPHLGRTPDEICALGVTFLGLLTSYEIRSAIHQAVVGVVNPNTNQYYETFCISAVEMQACGVPVIGGDIGGLVETIQHGLTGYRVTGVKELSNRIVQLLREQDRADLLGRNAAKFSGRFSSDEIAQKWVALIGEIEAKKEPEKLSFKCFPLSWGRYRALFLSISVVKFIWEPLRERQQKLRMSHD